MIGRQGRRKGNTGKGLGGRETVHIGRVKGRYRDSDRREILIGREVKKGKIINRKTREEEWRQGKDREVGGWCR